MSSTESDAAPGRLEALRSLVNTLHLPELEDDIGTPELASAWCRAHGLAPISGERELARLHAFRDALRELFFANHGDADLHAAWEGLRPFARAASLGIAIDPERGPVLEPGGAGADRTIAALLAVLYDSVTDGTCSRLRACKRDDCKWAYYDQSKNGSRAWCSMAVCGNREKAHRRRARDRAL